MNEAKLRLEIGDVLWFIAELCDCYGWSMEEIAIANIAKLRNRYESTFTVAESVNRQEYKQKRKHGRSKYYTSVKDVKGNA